MLVRFRTWRLRRAALALADAEYYVSQWGWSFSPSQDYRASRRIEKLQARVERIEAKV